MCFLAQGAAILSYSFDGDTTLPVESAFATGSAITAVDTRADLTASGGYSGGYLLTSSYKGPAASYWAFTVTTRPEVQVSVSGLTAYLQYGRQARIGALHYGAYSAGSLVPGSQSSFNLVNNDIGAAWTAETLPFSAPVTLGANTSYEIRFWASGQNGLPSGSLGFDSLTLEGAPLDPSGVPAVPEPSTWALGIFAGLFAAGTAARRVRQRRSGQ